MKLSYFAADGFKNLRGVSLTPDPFYNMILGENAQGKTNILEAIWLLTGCRSFRGTRDRECIAFDKDGFQVESGFQDSRREQFLRFCMVNRNNPQKKYWCNEVPRKSKELFSLFHCVAFTPESLELIESGPYVRREFLDMGSAQLSPKVIDLVHRYEQVLQQRNSVLKQRLPERETYAMLDIWDAQLARLGSEITVFRCAYVYRLMQTCCPLYREISGNRESIEIAYHSSVFPYECERPPLQFHQKLVTTYGEKLRSARMTDMSTGFTTVGVHRDDLMFYLGGDRHMKEVGSQGQKKSLALALKLAQARIFSDWHKESPIILLDDVMGELDSARQAVVSTIVQDMQVFVTTCHPESVLSPGNGKRFLLKDGRIARED